MSVDFDLLHTQIERHLKKIEEILPPSYKLTLLARCTAEDLDDADIMLTVDTLPDIERAIEKRKNRKGQP